MQYYLVMTIRLMMKDIVLSVCILMIWWIHTGNDTIDGNSTRDKYRIRIYNDSVSTIKLEVKYDEFMPGFITQLLELGNMRQTSYSKYCLAREK